MNDLPPLLPGEESASGAILTASPVDSGRLFVQRSRLTPIYVLLVLLIALAVGAWVASRTEIANLRVEVARHLKAGDVNTAETRVLVKSLNENVRDQQAKVAVLEGKQVESQSQQLALEQLYQDMSKKGDDWALTEIDQVLSTASQQLQLAGNVPGALIALQNADARLSRSDRPQFIALRRALGHDIDRLKALPTLDLTGIALRLDSIIGQIDAMPLLADEKPALPATQPKTSYRSASKTQRSVVTTPNGTKNIAGGQDWWYAMGETWQSWTVEIWQEIRQLIRIRSVEVPDALLLSPTQAYYARENLKLRLLNARLALLSRNESAFRSDLIASQETIVKYFDTRARQTQTAQTLLRQVQGSNLAIELPTLAESLNAVRNYKAKP